MESRKAPVSIERALEISLDEYIVESGLYVAPMLKQTKITEDEDVDLDTDEHVEIDRTTDLREKLLMSGRNKGYGKPDFPNVASSQWRLMRPNVQDQRPAGMPPLVPGNLEITCDDKRRKRSYITFEQSNNLTFQGKQNNSCTGRNRSFPQKKRQQNGRINSQGFNNSCAARNNFINKNHATFKNARSNTGNELYDLQIEATRSNTGNEVCDLQIEATPGSSDSSSRLFPENNQMHNSVFSPSLASLEFGEGIKLNLPKEVAAKMLGAVAGIGCDPKPKYDLEVQKEIHTLQNKPMFYKCPGREVVSSDGAGVNCILTPNTTGLSLNQRFA